MLGTLMFIKDAWNIDVHGTPLYRVVMKHRNVKKKLIDWKKVQHPLSSKLAETRFQLEESNRL